MPAPDLNQLVTLDVLLSECSVVRAAQRLQLSPSAMSRALARLRVTMGDPLLVRAGRGLVPTPRAIALRDEVGRLVDEARAVLRPEAAPDLSTLERSFTMRNREGFVETFGRELLARIRAEAPGVRLRFVQKTDKESTPLREGDADLETGVVGKATGPEVRVQALFEDRFIGVVRKGHPLSRGKITPARFAAGEHIAVTRRGLDRGPVNDVLAPLGLTRDIVAMVDSFAAALALVRGSDLIATVPERYTGSLRTGLHSFPLPAASLPFTVSLFWHPRLDTDPVHRWLRGCIREIVR